ncbi:MAG: cytochrome c oxidase subunit II [candidate division NC10 bacterium]|nr:cytochrome c oxidase subunit II [candidate division NC10 bacterium]
MLFGLRLFPEQASTMAGQVDALLLFLLAVSLFFIGLIFLTVIVFAIRYRRRSEAERPQPIHGSLPLELLWTIIPLGLALVMFGWGAWLYFALNRPPADAMEVFVVAKQWMWKFQHPSGMREINELHVPLGRPVKVTMTSEDAIHSFGVSDFRIKMDVVPGRYTTAWFEATKPGEYRLGCAEYCGTEHAKMVGRVVVMRPEAYEAWLRGAPTGISLAAAGEKVFQQNGCAACHLSAGAGPGPSLAGIFGKPVKLATGQTVTADDAYLRESILDPQAKLVAGYPPIMPSLKGMLGEEQVTQLLAYIKSLAADQKAKAAP